MFQIKHFVTSHGIVSYYYFFYQDISHDFNEFHANLAKSQPRIPRTSQASEQNGSTACHCVWPSQLTAQNSSDETLPPKKSENKHQKVSKSHKSGPPNQHSSQPDPNEIIIGGLFFQNIISKKTWGIHWIHHLLQVMAVHLENSARGNEFGSEFIGRFLLQKHPGDDCRSPWCSNLPMFFPLFFGVFFSATEIWADSSVAHRNLNVFLFFWGGPLKTHKKKEKKNMCLKKTHVCQYQRPGPWWIWKFWKLPRICHVILSIDNAFHPLQVLDLPVIADHT